MLNEKPAKRDFTCTKCGKYLQIIGLAYTKAYEGHDTCLSCRTTEKTDKVLTEEELKECELLNIQLTINFLEVKKLIYSHRSLNSRNGKLVLENDELMAENEKLKQEKFDLEASVILNVRENKRLKAELEELNHE